MRAPRLALLACAAWAAAGEPAVRLPPASMGKPAAADGAAAIRLTAEGQILVDRDGSEAAVSLEQLGAWLRARRERFDEAKKVTGKEGPSELTVVLRADEQAPWGHALWLLRVCARENLYRTEFGVRGASGEEGRLPAHLPKDKGSPGQKPRAAVSVEIFAKSEETTVWGPTQTGIRKPKELGYRVGETEAPGMEGVRRYLVDSYEPGVRGEIAAAANVPLAAVVALLDEYARAGLTDIGFKDGKAPTADQRRMPRLPYPG